MTKIIVNIKLKVRRVVLVSLSLPLGLYGVYLAQPKATSEKYNKVIKNRPQKAWAGLANTRLLLRRYA